jgi:hypothetical protein
VQSVLGHSPTAVDSLPLIPPVGSEANQTHPGNNDQVSCDGSLHVLLFAFRSVLVTAGTGASLGHQLKPIQRP